MVGDTLVGGGLAFHVGLRRLNEKRVGSAGIGVSMGSFDGCCVLKRTEGAVLDERLDIAVSVGS